MKGAYGSAEQVWLPEGHTAIAAWVLNAPSWHPIWSQYMLSVVTLEDREGWPPAKVDFDGATHELQVLALDPDHKVTGNIMKDGKELHYLLPVNVAHQFIATDEEMTELLRLAVSACVNGALNPETADAPERIRGIWLEACVKTLAHMRGEEHAP